MFALTLASLADKLIMKYILFGIPIILLLIISFKIAGNYFTKYTVEDKVLSEARITTAHSGYYLIYGDKETYTDTDSLIYWKFNSSDVYGHIQSGHTYRFTIYGWRVPFLSWYRNILTYQEIK